MPKSRLNEASNQGQIYAPGHWYRECERSQAYSTYNDVSIPAPNYPVPKNAHQSMPQWPCTQMGYTTGRLRNSADARIPNKCLQWSEIGV